MTDRTVSLGNTYEITQPPPSDALVLSRLSRWRLQSVARSVLPRSRTARCLRRLGFQSNHVQVRQAVANGATFYGGLTVCGSVWTCPVCAAKISERRSGEIVQGIETALSQGLAVYMLTLTVPHQMHEHLSDLLDKFTQARRLLRNRKPWKKFAGQVGLQGSVRALEVTFGANGWHVHTHELLICESPQVTEWSSRLLGWWQDACLSVGLGLPNSHGVDLVRVWSASEYLAKYGHDRKWNAGQELTKAMSKRGRTSYSPWDLLRAAGDGNVWARDRFREFAAHFHGKRQLVWSRGLRDRLGLGVEATDQELAEHQDEESILLGLLNPDQWKIVLSQDRRGELLEAARISGWAGVLALIASLLEMEDLKWQMDSR